MRRKKPFTLLEVLVVMGIITILAAILVGGVSVARRKSFDSATKAIIEKCALGLQNYRSRFGYFPPPIGAPGYTNFPDPKYLSRDALVDVPKSEVRSADTDGDGLWEVTDPRGHPLRYRCPGYDNPQMYDLWSVGADGSDDVMNVEKHGGHYDGKGDDIINWSQ